MRAGARFSFKYYQAESAAADVVGPVMPVANDRSLSLDVLWTGTLVGRFILKSSNTRDDASSFTEVPDAAAEFTAEGAVPAGTAQSTYLTCNFINMPGKWWRLDIDNTSSTGTVTVTGAQGDTLHC